MTSLILLSRLTWFHADLTFVLSFRSYIFKGWSYTRQLFAMSLNEENTALFAGLKE